MDIAKRFGDNWHMVVMHFPPTCALCQTRISTHRLLDETGQPMPSCYCQECGQYLVDEFEKEGETWGLFKLLKVNSNGMIEEIEED